MTRFPCLLAASILALGAAVPVASAQDLVVGFARDADTLDPGNHRNRETQTIIRNMYDGILTRDSSMEIHPELAESYTQVSPTEYDFVIRDGVRFHDGSAMTLEDVKFTLERLFTEGGMGDGQTKPAAEQCSDRFESVRDQPARTPCRLRRWQSLSESRRARAASQEVVRKNHVRRR